MQVWILLQNKEKDVYYVHSVQLGAEKLLWGEILAYWAVLLQQYNGQLKTI